MKAKTLIEMMKQEEYQALTCKEFAEIVERAGVIEDEDGIPAFLKTDFEPTSVQHYTNKDKK